MSNTEQQTQYPAGLYEYTLNIGYASARSATVDVPGVFGMSIEQWNDLNDEEKVNTIQAHWESWVTNYIEGGFACKEES